MMKNILMRFLFLVIVAFPVSSTYAYYVDVEPDTSSEAANVFQAVWFHLNTSGDAAYEDMYTGTLNGVTFTYSAVDAGLFNLNFSEGSSPGAIKFSTYAFCAEILIDAEDGVADLKGITGTGMTQAAWLMDTYLSSGNSIAMNAGLQLAIWQVLYPTVLFPMTEVNSIPLDTSVATYLPYYQQYRAGLLAAGALTGFSAENYRLVDFDGKQDMLTVVPEPGTILLMGLGLLGLAGSARRRKTQK